MTYSTTRSALRILSLLALNGLLVAACDNDDHGPYPADVVGPYCRSHLDCESGYCCATKDCGGGMCSYRCDHDRDCPYGSLCEGHICFLSCASDYDCYSGQRCEHHHTVCQY